MSRSVTDSFMNIYDHMQESYMIVYDRTKNRGHRFLISSRTYFSYL